MIKLTHLFRHTTPVSHTRFSRHGLAAILAISALLPITNSHATAFTSDISITGETDFDHSYPNDNESGAFDLISGGSTTTSTYSNGAIVTGPDPLPGSLTDVGDGFGFDGTATATEDWFGIGFDTDIDVSNTSATDSYDVVFGLNFSNAVNADGLDAFAASELTLDIDLVEAFFSDLISDTLPVADGGLGDEIGGVLQDTFGVSLMESATGLIFTLALDPGDTIDILLSWTLDGGDYDSGLAEADLSAFLYIDSVTNTTSAPPPPPSGVPETGTLFLFSAGLVGLFAKRRRLVKVRG